MGSSELYAANTLHEQWSDYLVVCAADAEEGSGDRGEGVFKMSHADIQQNARGVPQWSSGLLQVLTEGRPQHLPSLRPGFQDLTCVSRPDLQFLEETR